MRKVLSNIKSWIKSFYRNVFLGYFFKKIWREIHIKKVQDERIQQFYDKNTRKLIVFLVPGADPETGEDRIGGGIISIASIYQETANLMDVHDSKLIMCTVRGSSVFLKHMKFDNDIYVYRFGQIVDYFTNLDQIIIHLPEVLAPRFIKTLNKKDISFFKKLNFVHINIMNQNIHLMPKPDVIAQLKQYATKVTMTTAHHKYCTTEMRNKYGIPIHQLSVWISPEKYVSKKWEEKENLVLISPDPHPFKDKVLNKLSTINGLEVRIIKSLSYEEYKKLISKAKWIITFGEGLDGYFIEGVFSGAVGFAIYNEVFFSSDFKTIKNIYPSAENMLANIDSDIARLDNVKDHPIYLGEQFAICSKYYNTEKYLKNIKDFYLENYTFK